MRIVEKDADGQYRWSGTPSGEDGSTHAPTNVFPFPNSASPRGASRLVEQIKGRYLLLGAFIGAISGISGALIAGGFNAHTASIAKAGSVEAANIGADAAIRAAQLKAEALAKEDRFKNICSDLTESLKQFDKLFTKETRISYLNDLLSDARYKDCASFKMLSHLRDDQRSARGNAPQPAVKKVGGEASDLEAPTGAGENDLSNPYIVDSSVLPIRDTGWSFSVKAGEDQALLPLKFQTTTLRVRSGVVKLTADKIPRFVCLAGQSFNIFWQETPDFNLRALGRSGAVIDVIAITPGFHLSETQCH